MLKNYMWNLFQNTGNIKSYVFYKEIVESENSLSEEKISLEQAAITHIN